MNWTHKHRCETSTGCDLSYSTGDRSTLAGPLITVPLWSKIEPWHGQLKVPSIGFHLTTHPKCGQTAAQTSATSYQSTNLLTYYMLPLVSLIAPNTVQLCCWLVNKQKSTIKLTWRTSRPELQSLSSTSTLQIWWDKVKEYELFCVPKMVEIGSFTRS